MQLFKQTIEWLLYAFIFLLPLQTHYLYRQLLINNQSWQYGALKIYATELLFFIILCLAIFIFFKTKSEKARGKFSLTKMVAILSFLTLCALNLYLAISRELAFYKLTIYIQAIALFFLLFAIKIKFEKISWLLVLSGGVQAIFAIIQSATQKVFASTLLGMASQNPAILGTPVIETSDGRWLRAFGTFPHPNILAGFLVFAILCGIFLFVKQQTEKNKKTQIILAGLISLNSTGLLLTFSRAAIVALFIAILCAAICFIKKENRWRERLKKLLIAVSFVAIAFLCVSLTSPNLIMTRINNEQRLEAKSNAERISEYKLVPALLGKFWLFGAGAGNYTLAISEINPNQPAWYYQPIHNAILLEIIEFGLTGILLLIIFVAAILKKFSQLFSFNTASTALLFALLTLAIFDHYLSSMYSGVLLTSIISYLTLSHQ